MLCCVSDFQFFIFFCVVDINDSGCVTRFLWFFHKSFQCFYDLSLLIISKDQIYGSICFQFLCICLNIAACSYYDCVRVHFFCFVKHLTRFAVCNIGNCTGIYNIYICPFCKRHNLISRFFQKLLHSLNFICIYFTAQIVKGYFFAHIIPQFFYFS